MHPEFIAADRLRDERCCGSAIREGLKTWHYMPGLKARAKQFEEIHETIGNVGYFLIGLHAAAALINHFYFRDNTLVRMLPSRSEKWAS